VILCRGEEILARDLPRDMLEPDRPVETAGPVGYHAARARAVDDFERDFLVSLLQECGGIVSRAAHRSGLSERHLHVKLKKYGLRGRDFRMRNSV